MEIKDISAFSSRRPQSEFIIYAKENMLNAEEREELVSGLLANESFTIARYLFYCELLFSYRNFEYLLRYGMSTTKELAASVQRLTRKYVLE